MLEGKKIEDQCAQTSKPRKYSIIFRMVIDLFPGWDDGYHIDDNYGNYCLCQTKNDENHDWYKTACEADTIDPIEFNFFLGHESIDAIDTPEEHAPDLCDKGDEISLRVESVGINPSDEYPEKPRIGM
jgi:hypothetical protein